MKVLRVHAKVCESAGCQGYEYSITGGEVRGGRDGSVWGGGHSCMNPANSGLTRALHRPADTLLRAWNAPYLSWHVN